MATPWHVDAASHSDDKRVVGVMFGDYLDAIADPGPDLWRKFGIGVCDYAITHDLPPDELREWLTVLGVVEVPADRTKRDSDGRPKRTKGRCPVCRRRISLRTNGDLCGHPTSEGRDDRCGGSGGRPAPANGSEAVAS